MAGSGRTPEDLRRDIAAERDELMRAIHDLRAGLQDARKIPALAGGALVAGLGLAAAVTAIRRRRRSP